MRPFPCVAVVSAITAATALAQVPLHVVAPSEQANTDAVSSLWVPGASRPVRQMTLVGVAHLTAVVGRPILALELRRNAADEQYDGGTAQLTVRLSTAVTNPLSCSPVFADNSGTDETLVFAGPVTIPASPSQPGPHVPWTPANTIRIPFATPFVYLGGTLCIDVVGLPIAGQNANWWVADAAYDLVRGTTTDLGGGCGPFGGPESRWSHAVRASLHAGAYGQFFAFHEANTVGLAVFGDGMAPGLPLSWLGLPSPPECELHLSSIVLMVPALFDPMPPPMPPSSAGRADVLLPFANDAAFLGLRLTTQWLELATWHTSNAIEWSTAATVPMLGMALVEGAASEPDGLLSAHIAHVWRIEYL